MARPRRSPLHIAILAIAIGLGLFAGVVIIIRHLSGAPQRALWPDVHVENAAAQDLARYHFKLTGREPASWRDISLRLYQDERGSATILRCAIDAAEVERLLRFPPGSVRPPADVPPAEWPWRGFGTGETDPARVPAWWRPVGPRSRLFSAEAAGTATGLFANYDPTTALLHVWQWTWKRDAAAPTGGSTRESSAVLALAAAVSERQRRLRVPMIAGWHLATGIPPGDLGLERGILPGDATRIDAFVVATAQGHRCLLAIHGIADDPAAALVADLPLRALPDDAAPPIAAWAFALPPPIPGDAGAPAVGPAVTADDTPGELPAWFQPGRGRSGSHCLIDLGDGRVGSGRWIAHDAARRILWVWEWSDVIARDAVADLVPSPVMGGGPRS